MPSSKREDLNWAGLVSECRSMLECALATEVEANALLRKRARYKWKLADKNATSLEDWFGAIISETDLLLFIRTRRERIGYYGRTETIDRPIARRIHGLYCKARTLSGDAGTPGGFAWTAHHGFLAAIGWSQERRQAVRDWIESDPLSPKNWTNVLSRELKLLEHPTTSQRALEILGSCSAFLREAASRIPGSVELLVFQLTVELRHLVALNRSPRPLPPELLPVREGSVARRVLRDLVDCTGNSSLSDRTIVGQIVAQPADCQQRALLCEYLKLRGNAVDAWYALARVQLEDNMGANLLATLGTFARTCEVGIRVTKSESLVKIFLNMMADILGDVERGSPEHKLAVGKMVSVVAVARRLGLFSKENEVLLRVIFDLSPRHAKPNAPILLAK